MISNAFTFTDSTSFSGVAENSVEPVLIQASEIRILMIQSRSISIFGDFVEDGTIMDTSTLADEDGLGHSIINGSRTVWQSLIPTPIIIP